jgi:D-alanyl-D-alanine carboxypeptidase (penicillin-binding protein 5/6)
MVVAKYDQTCLAGKDSQRDKDGSLEALSPVCLAPVSVPQETPSGSVPVREEFGMAKKKKESPTKSFLQRMNKLAESLGMINTSYCNPHGLMNKFNFSSCHDVGKLLAEASKLEPFMRVIGALNYSNEIVRHGQKTTVQWTNTHKCFDDKRFVGGKTGTTVAAGACLSTLMRLSKGKMIVVVVLNSKHQ